jgi:hypothetical protein
MQMQREVRPEIADKRVVLAKTKGVSMDDLLQEMLNRLEPSQEALAAMSVEDFERHMNELSEGLEHLSVGYLDSYSREDIYLDHD